MTELGTASVTDRLASLGAERWELHFEARKRVLAGEDLIELTIGEPDLPTPPHLIEVAYEAMKAGRTRYSGGAGELGLRQAVAEKYSKRSGRTIGADEVLGFPGTQAALTLCMMALVEEGDAVMLPDPYYATYEGVVRCAGAEFVPIPMDAGNDFHLTAQQLEEALVPNAKVLLLNSPHNPTGATLTANEIVAIGDICKKHNLWILSDEVYEPLIYDGDFASPFDDDDLADRTIAVASISKSHAAPGFRSGWAVGPRWFMERAQSVSEAILFGGQPFIADMTEHALRNPDDTADRMGAAYKARIELLMNSMADSKILKPMRPAAGMFMLIDVSASGMDGASFARKLLDYGVGVMPGDSFGAQAKNFIRLSLTVDADRLQEAARRMNTFVNDLTQ